MNADKLPRTARQLEHLFDAQLQLVRQYRDYLDQVKASVTENNIEQLGQLLSQNPINLRDITQLRDQQAALVRQHGYTEAEDGLPRLIADCQRPGLQQLGDTLADELVQLQKSLLINDLLIRKNQQRVRQSVQILSGRGRGTGPATYSRRGDTEVEKAGQTLALA